MLRKAVLFTLREYAIFNSGSCEKGDKVLIYGAMKMEY
jgi:hypothetical protein